VLADRMLTFSFGGWTRPEARTVTDVVEVLTPPTSVRALVNGFAPVLHPTADRRLVTDGPAPASQVTS
jgi:hypothetical protein